MTTQKIPVNENTLLRAGWTAREENAILDSIDIDGVNVRGSCIEITKHVIHTLHQHNGIPKDDVIEYRCHVGEAMELHYAVAVAAHHITDCDSDTGFVIVDASIDQFCDENHEFDHIETTFGPYDELPSVAVLPPGDDRRREWYHNPNGSYDTDSEFKPGPVK